MTMTTPLRKLTLTVHVITSVGWLGALAVFLAHALASVISQDEQMVRAASLAMGLTAWFVILPLSLASLTTGLIQALGTAWGLLRHYWILFKLLLTGVATIVLLLKMGPISYLTEVAAETTFSSADLMGLRTSLMVHAGGGLCVLLAAVTLAVYKPQGMTPYGLRKQHEQGNAGTASGRVTSMPRWVKIFGAILIILILMIGVMLLGGSHGPGAHLSVPFGSPVEGVSPAWPYSRTIDG
jgi:predicted secreted protein